jgi:hypothetical protein
MPAVAAADRLTAGTDVVVGGKTAEAGVGVDERRRGVYGWRGVFWRRERPS